MKRRAGHLATWRPPTRRAFVAMIAAAVGAIAIRDRSAPEPRRASFAGSPGKPRWIGHC